MLRLFLKPFCSSTKVLLQDNHLSSLSFKTEQYNLYVAGAKVIPLYERGSRGSAVLDFGIGFIISFPHSDGMTPVAKQTLKRTCRNETQQSLRKTSEGIPSTPHAFSLFALNIALCTSKTEIASSNSEIFVIWSKSMSLAVSEPPTCR